MASKYPAELDSLSTTSANATASLNTHPALHNDANDAINKIELALGAYLGNVAFNVKAAGAKGDNSNDDTSEIQAAIDAASAAGGGMVFFPAGTYKISAALVLKEKVYLKGVGPGSKIFLANSSNTDVIKSNKAGEGGADETIIEDLKIDGNKANNSSGGCGINLDGRKTAANRVHIWNCKEDALKVRRTASQLPVSEGSSDQIFWDIYAVNCTGNGMVSDTNDVSFSQCRAAGNLAAGFKTTSNGVATLFNDCHAWSDVSTEYCFNLEGSWDAVNCQAEGAATANVRCKAGGRWTGGRVFGAGSNTNTCGFLILENGTQVNVSNVLIKEVGTGGAFRAGGSNVGSGSTFHFLLEGGTSTAFTLAESATWSGNIRIDPDLRGSTTIGTPPGPNSVASASTITLTSNNLFFSITGTTEIKKINATYAGHVVVLRWTSTAKMARGENLKLAVATIEPTADDALMLACDGTNWYQVSPLQANS